MNIHYAPRDESFKKFIAKMLNMSGLSDQFLNKILNSQNFKFFDDAFTSITANEMNNYEWLEQLGDSIHSHFFVNYMYRRFPRLRNAKGQKIIARVKNKYASHNELARLGEKYNFAKFISAGQENLLKDKKKMLEDVFEAFIGAVQFVCDNVLEEHLGYIIIAKILTEIYDQENIDINYESLVDSKTQLKELHDKYKELGEFPFLTEKNTVSEYIMPDNKLIHIATIFDNNILIGKGKAFKKNEAQQIAAEQALKYYKNLGYKLEY